MRYKIKEQREALGISQEELSIRSGVSRAIISRLESGEEVTTSTKTLSKIAETLNKKVSDIFLE